jgi:hypothetical protein
VANPLTFLLPLRYDRVRRVLLVQSGPIDLAAAVAKRVRTVFPGCTLEVVVREADHEAAEACAADEITLARWEDRSALLRRLRRGRYDAVVGLLSSHPSQYLRLLPFVLRTRAILYFNDNLDYFPLHLARLPALAYHVSGGESPLAVLPWLAGRAIMLPLVTLYLVAWTARLRWRAGRRPATARS